MSKTFAKGAAVAVLKSSEFPTQREELDGFDEIAARLALENLRAGIDRADRARADLAGLVSAQTVRAAFAGRRGHGGGECSRRVLRPWELDAIVRAAVLEALERAARGA